MTAIAVGITPIEARPVTGMESVPAGPNTDVIVPMSILNGEQGFPDQELQYRLFGNWTSQIVVAGDRKMLTFRTADRSLTDINATFMGTSIQKIDLARTGLAPGPVRNGVGASTALRRCDEKHDNQDLPRRGDRRPRIG